jgi:hypothetical protein
MLSCVVLYSPRKFLHEAADELEVGEMVHGPAFSLYEAMSAIEMMNPKMDPGIIVDNPPPSVTDQLHRGLF